MDVVILAGGQCSPELNEAAGQKWLKDIQVGGVSLLSHTKSCVTHIAEPLIVGGEPMDGSRTIPSGAHFIDSLGVAVDNVQDETFLMTTVDLPCLTSEAVDDFISKSDPEAAFNYPIVDIEIAKAAFPDMKRTTLRLRDGTFTGGNVSVLRTELVRQAMPIIKRAYEFRKSPVKLASLIGFGTLFKVAATKLAPSVVSISSLERSVSKFLGTKVKAIETAFPEIAADLDSAEQYHQFIQHFRLSENCRS